MMVTIAVSLAMPSSDTITVIGGVLIAVGAMITGILKAALPFLEMKYKHQENMARMQAERIRSQMPDSEVEDDPKTKQPPNDHAKVARVRRRRKDKPQPPDEPDEQNHEPGQ
jgi:hypothetical protein